MPRPPQLPAHAVPLDQGWAAWRTVCLRGAGFPAELLSGLASPELARASGELLADEERAPGGAGLGAKRAEVEALFAAARARASAALREVARDPRFREAVLWQNRAAVRTALDPLLRRPEGASDSRTRQHEWLVASYLQRYCAKNDSIGFFGPVGWGTFEDGGPPLELEPGPALLSRREVHLEHWAVEALAAAIARVPGLRPWLPPRRAPLIRVEGARVITPFGEEALPPPVAAALGACDGERSAREIAAGLVSRGLAGGEGEALALLEGLAQQELIAWTLEVPTVGERRERDLRARLEAVGDPAVRAAALAPLAELEAGRDRVARAAGDPAALERALESLDQTFTRLTGQAPTRRQGQTYAGRTVAFEDCRRGVALRIGPQLRARLGRPLSLLLAAGRWCSHHLARRYAGELLAAFRALSAEQGRRSLRLLEFWPSVASMFPRVDGVAPPSVQAVLRDYQARWTGLVGGSLDPPRIALSSELLGPRLREAFAAPAPGWPTARFHSPDLMIAARDVEAIRKGDCFFVLGELHSTSNTLEQELFVREHPDPEALRRWLEADLPGGRLSPAVARSEAGRCHVSPMSRHPLDVTLEFDDALSWRPRAQTVAMSELEVSEEADRLVVAARGGARRWDLIEALDLLLTEYTVPLLPEAPHTPRVTLDDLVLCRETWRCEARALDFARAKEPLDRYLGARRWARRLGIPRFTFFKASTETKPHFLDLDSPTYVEGFAKQVRGAGAVTLSEMLPTLEQRWLTDAEGRRYTCELRVIAVDPEPWRPAS